MRLTRRGFISAIAGGAATSFIHPVKLIAKTEKTIQLPKPSLQGSGTLMEALINRRSTRTFSEKAIPSDVLSNLLWAAFGTNRKNSEKRTAPSAWNEREIDIYVARANGLYLYRPMTHDLSIIDETDIRHLTGTQKFVKKAPVNLIYVSDYSRFKNSPKKKQDFYTAANTGFISQNVYLFCAVEGLATVVRDWIDRPALAKAMNLRTDQKIMLAQTVGYPEEK